MKKVCLVAALVVLAVASLTLFATTSQAKARVITENHWQVALNRKLYHGSMEVRVPTGIIDISTEKEVVEVDKLSNFALGMEQVLRYAKATGKKPVLAVYIDGDKDALGLLKEVQTGCEAQGISLILVNSYVGVNDLLALLPQPEPAEAITQPVPIPQPTTTAPSKASPQGQDYWITTSSGVRHNSGCRWYMNSNGRKCTKSEGRACKICGG